jgi:hypothetical protein
VGQKKAETVIFTNDENTTLSLSSIVLGGTNASDFSQTNNCGKGRKAGWDCTIAVTFDPGAIGTRSGTLTITDAAGARIVSLSGTGVSVSVTGK